MLEFEFCKKWRYNGFPQGGFISRLEMEIKSQIPPVLTVGKGGIYLL